MARTYAIENAYDKAFEFVDEALKRDKYLRDAYVLKGMMFRAQNKIDLAISSFQTAVEMDANFYSGYVALGNLYEQKNDPLAFEYYKTALGNRLNRH
jgi:tetratricopeptide (TPR) repeat protein